MSAIVLNEQNPRAVALREALRQLDHYRGELKRMRMKALALVTGDDHTKLELAFGLAAGEGATLAALLSQLAAFDSPNLDAIFAAMQ